MRRKISLNKLDYKPKRLGLIYSPPTIGIIKGYFSHRVSGSFH